MRELDNDYFYLCTKTPIFAWIAIVGFYSCWHPSLSWRPESVSCLSLSPVFTPLVPCRGRPPIWLLHDVGVIRDKRCHVYRIFKTVTHNLDDESQYIGWLLKVVHLPDKRDFLSHAVAFPLQNVDSRNRSMYLRFHLGSCKLLRVMPIIEH